MKRTGIYRIRNKVNGKAYVGQSVNIADRFVRHRYQLNKGIHRNVYLQRSWNKYGSSCFDFEVLVECEELELDILEEQWASEMPKEALYNISDDFTSRAGTKNPFFGKKHSEESKKKMSEWKKRNYIGKNNQNYGNEYSKETRLKMVERNSSTKLDVDKVLSIVDMLKNGQEHQMIADKFGVNRTVVTRISNGTRWANVTGGPVEPVQYKDGKRVFSEVHKQRIGQKRKKAWAIKNTA